MVVFDATILLPVLWPGVPPPVDPNTGEAVTKFRERIDHLVATLEKDKTKIILPTPAISEILVRAGEAGPEYFAKINSVSAFKIAPFDTRAAVEVAMMTHGSLNERQRRNRDDQTVAKMKYDRQIVAIAKVEGASVIYSDDRGMVKMANAANISVIRTSDLPLPPEDLQSSLFEMLGAHDTENDESGS